MRTRRMTEINTDTLKVGDVIGFTLTTGEEVEAMAMKEESDGMIFAFVDCLEEERPMLSHDVKDLPAFLNEDLLQTFPGSIRERMMPFDEEIYLRLMTQKEVFGRNVYDSDINDDAEQFEPMKDRRNRIAYQGKNASVDDWEWYWLADRLRDVASAAYFCLVNTNGYCNYVHASASLGVRPAFKICKS